MIVIRSTREGFRRCGIAHPKDAVAYPDDYFTYEQLDILLNEPLLEVSVLHDVDDEIKTGLAGDSPNIIDRQLDQEDLSDQAIVDELSHGNAIDVEKTTESVIEEHLDTSGLGYPLLPSGDVIDETTDNGDSEAKEDAYTDGLGTDQVVVDDKSVTVTTKPSKKQAK